MEHYQFVTLKKLIRDKHKHQWACVINLVTLQLVVIIWESNEDSPMEVFKDMITPKTIIQRLFIGLVVLTVVLLAQRLFF